MDERTAEIVRDIGENRLRLAEDFDQLGGKLRAASDWRSYFARQPWLTLGVALMGGFLLSGLFSWRSR